MRKLLLITAIVSIALAGCNKDDEGNGGGGKGGGKITMTVKIKGDETQINLAGKGTATIDWGDDSAKETHTLAIEAQDFDHKYSNSVTRTITITGENITHFYYGKLEQEVTSLDVSGYKTLTNLACTGSLLKSLDVSKNTALEYLNCIVNQLKNLDVSKNIKLKELRCSGNQLTSLDVSKNTELTMLWCGGNNLDAAALNALFGTLHNNGGYISISGNPGTAGCTPKIATDKGWYVDTFMY